MTGETRLLRVLTRRDVLALAFGAMIGWGWVILSGAWITRGGSVGAILAFALVGAALLVVSLLYAELAAAMPRVGGEHVYSLRALGYGGSFVCTWFLVFAYVSVCCFEAVALPTVVDYFGSGWRRVHLWSVAGYDVYLTWALLGAAGAAVITIINVLGIRIAAVFQGVATLLILAAGLVLITGAGIDGKAEHLDPWFAAGTAGVLTVVAMVPFFFTGFDVIPQAAEEIDLPHHLIGALTAISVLLAVLWYCVVIACVALLADREVLEGGKLVTAEAARVAWSGPGAALLVIGGIAGIITSWNAFVVGGSRAMYAMAESGMLPAVFARLHPRYRTPHAAIIFIGVTCAMAPFFGRQALIWLVNAGGLAVVVAYLMVCASFLQLRRREPEMPRPFRLPFGPLLGWTGLAGCVAIALVYLPGSPSALAGAEWVVLGLWSLAGAVFYAAARRPA